MVFVEFCLTKLNHTKARSHFNSYCLRKILCIFFALSFTSHAFSVEWQEPETTSSWKGLWGQRDDDCVYIGMWTRHLLPGSNKRLSNINRLIGFNYKGIFGAAFLNSHKDQSYTLGLQRIVYSQKFDHYIQIDAGYRVGLIWGYKRGTSPIASAETSIPGIENWNPIPFVQLIGNFSWEIVGVQVSYCWAVFTLGFFVKF